MADILLVYITWTKLNGRDTARDIRPSRRLSLSDILLRDGTSAYSFAVMTRFPNNDPPAGMIYFVYVQDTQD